MSPAFTVHNTTYLYMRNRENKGYVPEAKTTFKNQITDFPYIIGGQFTESIRHITIVYYLFRHFIFLFVCLVFSVIYLTVIYLTQKILRVNYIVKRWMKPFEAPAYVRRASPFLFLKNKWLRGFLGSVKPRSPYPSGLSPVSPYSVFFLHIAYVINSRNGKSPVKPPFRGFGASLSKTVIKGWP